MRIVLIFINDVNYFKRDVVLIEDDEEIREKNYLLL